jgi:histidinol-phosphate aminotransferase
VHGGIKLAELRELGLRLEDCLDFSASVSPLGPPEGVAEAIAAVDLAAYPDPHSLALTEAIARHHRQDGVGVGNVLVGNGSTEIIHLLARAFIGTPDAGVNSAVLLLTPTYSEYGGAAAIAGGAVTNLEADRFDDGFGWDVGQAAERIAGERPALVFVCNPNNPTGALIDRAGMEALTGAAESSGSLLIVDEAYINLSERYGEVDLVSLAAASTSVVVLRSMTKDYALTALRLGYAVAAERIINRLAELQPDWSVNGLAQAAGVVALSDDGYLARARAEVRASRECVEERFEALGIRCYPTAANYVLAAVGDAALLRDGLARQGFFVRDCTSFGLPDCIRIGLRPVDDCLRLADAVEQVWYAMGKM